MKTSSFRLYALLVCCVALGACSQTTELSRLQYTPYVNSAPEIGGAPLSYRVLHSFGADHDGNGPNQLISIGDTFYGTTALGGANYCPRYGGGGCGTVFSITTGGTEKVLHNFRRGTKGNQPYAGLIYVSGTLYGTTAYGGAFGDGTVFSITTDGSEKVLHSFGEGNDGKYPSAGLTDVGGTLYGTTYSGGSNLCRTGVSGFESCGTVFSITTVGREKVLHSFGKGTDGRFPSRGLIYASGTLYGTTYFGGTYHYGTVFRITTGGREKVLHSFGKGNDGYNPAGDLLDVKGTLYGTTSSGGAPCHASHSYGCGTVFSITRGGSEKVLHSFGKGTDGSSPDGGLIDVGGTLYGTTLGGGKHCVSSNGCGTVFSITAGGAETVLHNFGKGTGGHGPADDLTYKSGSLFGTTYYGGGFGGGVVFSLTP